MSKQNIVIAKNQNKLMEIFDKFPTAKFAQRELWEQTQIKYPASVHSALMALVKKGEIERLESVNGSRNSIRYRKANEANS